MTAYEADLESDLSAIHRIDDMHTQAAERIFRLARRLQHYQGAIRSTVLAAQRHDRPYQPAAARPAADGVDWVPSDPQSLARSPLAHLISFGKGEGTGGR